MTIDKTQILDNVIIFPTNTNKTSEVVNDVNVILDHNEYN
jgi:hypothetical protein